MSKVLGIDPGLDGALVLVRSDVRHNGSQITAFCDMPTIDVVIGGRAKRRIDPVALVDWLVGCGQVDLVVLEEVASSPQMGVASSFAFGEGYGLIQGILTTLQRSYQLVRPQVWCKELGVVRDKGRHRQMASRLYPSDTGLFTRVKDNGRADAALLATYGARHLVRAA